MSFFRNKFIMAIAVITATVVLLVAVSNIGGPNNPVANVVRTIFYPAQMLVTKVTSSVNDFTVFIWEMQSYKGENERLVSEINELKKESRSIEDYKEENERLSSLLTLKEQITDYETEAAQVISYGGGNWYDSIQINKGTKHGLAIENIVITTDGVMGQITEIGKNWAKVSTIINPDNAVGVRIIRTSDIAIVEGDILLSQQAQCKMSFISKGASIVIGDILETSGLGGVYPSGLSVGKVREIKSDNTGTLQYAVIEPFVNFDKIHEVLVIKTTE